MADYIFKVNSYFDGGLKLEIEADGYVVEDGYFNFYADSTAVFDKVASLKADKVASIERTAK